jgi:hypothetical protein
MKHATCEMHGARCVFSKVTFNFFELCGVESSGLITAARKKAVACGKMEPLMHQRGVLYSGPDIIEYHLQT